MSQTEPSTQTYKNLPPSGYSNQSLARKNFRLNYDPENNKNNIYARKLQGVIPQTNNQFAENPLTKMLQPVHVTKSKRFARDKLNVSDIPGAQADVYKKHRNIEGREYIDTGDIEGARPAQLKQSKPMTGPDYKLYTKDINPEKWKSKRIVDPLKPEYDVPTKSGRLMRMGVVEGSQPKMQISPQTKRFANYIDDIEGTRPRKFNAVTDEQRLLGTFKSQDFSHKSNYSATRNSNAYGLEPIQQNKLSPIQQQILKDSQNHNGPVPNSHYSRFQSFQSLQQTAKFGGLSDNQSNQTVNNSINNNSINNNNQKLTYPPLPTGSIQQQNRQKQQQSFPLMPQSQMMQIQELYSAKERPKQSSQMDSLNYGKVNTVSSPILQNQEIASNNRPSLKDRVGSKRLNTYDLLNGNNSIDQSPNAGGTLSPQFNDQNVYQNLRTDQLKPYFNAQLGPQSNTLEAQNSYNGLSGDAGLEDSPIIKNRVWSKARVIGQEMNDQQNRIHSSASQATSSLVDKNLNLKRNFNENIYQKGMMMNSGHRSFVSGQQSQAINPLNNEINKSVDANGGGAVFNSKIPQSRDQRLNNKIQKLFNNPLNQGHSNYGGTGDNQSQHISNFRSSNSNGITKSMLPPTTSKVYGNFLDGKQIDQMILQLKQSNQNPLI